MPDDDPIEDLQRAGATAGAAGARAVEAALRSRERQTQQAHEDQPRKSVAQWEAEARKESALSGYGEPMTEADRSEFVTQLGREVQDKVDSGAEWHDAPGGPSRVYDSPEARADRHDAMEAAGVALEPRQAAVTADKMNATDPRLAAASGSVHKTQRPRTARQPQRERSR